MIKENTLKIFLSNGITLTVKENEKIFIKGQEESFAELYELIATCISNKNNVEFSVEIDHEYEDENKKKKHQVVKHEYFIPSEKITWFMIEEV